MNSKKGFTLIEILIVVAIIGILASVVLVGLGSSQKAARDARRVSDLRQIQTALELYMKTEGVYPDGTGGEPVDNFATMKDEVLNPTSGALLGIANIPDDVRAGAATPVTYLYGTDPTGTQYVLGAELEGPAPAGYSFTVPADVADMVGLCVAGSGAQVANADMYCVTL